MTKSDDEDAVEQEMAIFGAEPQRGSRLAIARRAISKAGVTGRFATKTTPAE